MPVEISDIAAGVLQPNEEFTVCAERTARGHPTDPSPNLPVVIVGGGLTGLAAAYDLARQGRPVRVLEAEPFVGGRVRTVTFSDGLTIDTDLDEARAGAAMCNLVKRLALPVVAKSRYSSLVLDGRLYHSNLDPTRASDSCFTGADRDAFQTWNRVAANVARQIDLVGRWSANDTPLPPLGSPLDWLRPLGFDTFVIRLNLTTPVAHWIRLMLESEHGVEWCRVTALDGMNAMRPFLTMQPTPWPPPRKLVLGRGHDRLVRELISALPPDAITTNCRAHRIVDHGLSIGVDVHAEDASGGDVVFRGSRVVVALPARAVGNMEIASSAATVSPAVQTTCAGGFVHVFFRLGANASRYWDEYGDDLFPLLTDGPCGCVHLVRQGLDGEGFVLRVSLHGHWATALTGCSQRHVVGTITGALDHLTVTTSDGDEMALFPGLSRFVTNAVVRDDTCEHHRFATHTNGGF